MTTNNGDMPAMPCRQGVINKGLTKREQFAMAAMQGFCADSSMATENIPKSAIDMADAPLAELDKAGGE